MAGVGSHSSMHPCLYCTGHKVDAEGKKTNQAAHRWVLGSWRTIRTQSETFQRHRDKWRGRAKISAKKDRQNFDSVVYEPVTWQRGKDDTPILLLCPPDPLHVVKLGIPYF